MEDKQEDKKLAITTPVWMWYDESADDYSVLDADGVLIFDGGLEADAQQLMDALNNTQRYREALDMIADGREEIWQMYPDDSEEKAVMDFAKNALGEDNA